MGFKLYVEFLEGLSPENKSAVLEKLKKKRPGDAGLDLMVFGKLEAKSIFAGRGLQHGPLRVSGLCHTGVKVAMVEVVEEQVGKGTQLTEYPVGFDLRMRSSSTKTPYIMQNSPGTIDLTYTGELLVRLAMHGFIEPRYHPDLIESGLLEVNSMLVQVVLPGHTFEVEIVDTIPGYLDEHRGDRGAGGFGSTDTKQ